jgi:hypothetical protein
MSNKQQKKCSSGKFKRLNYYHGMLLTEQDLQVEQNYFREKMKLHNRLHGYGVVWGLELKAKCIEIEGKSVEKIFIEPGFALDCAGNEIVVCYPHLVPLDEKIEELCQGCKPWQEGTKLVIVIKYCECKSEPQPQYTSQCAEDELHPEMSRICEGYCVQVLEEKDVPDCCKNIHDNQCCQPPKQDCPGLAGCCEDEHVLVLGCFKLPPQEICKKERCERNFSAENIDPCCSPRRVCTPCLEPSSQWERQKQVLVREACLVSEDWIDFSEVIGKSVPEARSYLNQIGLNMGYTRSIQGQNPKQLMQEVANAVSCARREAVIDLITDKNGCVLFALCRDGTGDTLGDSDSPS